MRASLSGPILLSMALHTACLLVLLAIRATPADPPPPVLRVQLVQSVDFIDDDGAPAEQLAGARRSLTGPNTDEDHVQPEASIPADRLAVIDPDAQPGESPVEAADPAGTDTTATRMQVATADVAPPRPTSLEPVSVTTPAAQPPPAAAADAVTEVAANPVPRPVRELEPGELRMLAGRFQRFSERRERIDDGTPQQWTHQGRSYSAQFTRLPAGDEMGLDEILVEVRTGLDGEQVTTELRLRRLAFSSFAQFVDRWDSSVQMHDDEIDGRFHSNSEIHVSPSRTATPVFHGLVTTPRGINTSYAERRVRREDMFPGGLDTRSASIALPRRLSVELREELTAGGNGERIEQDSRIVFSADGGLEVAPLSGRAPSRRRTLPAGPFYLIGTDRVTLHVSGHVRGQVLVYSQGSIVIDGNLTYAGGSAGGAADGHFLGLVAERDVEIADPAVTGPGDLQVDAAIFAKRSFLVRRYRSRAAGTLSIFGSLSAGSLSATEPRFRTHLRFDPRLDQARPPSFPLTEQYELAEQDHGWHLAP